MIRTVVAGIDPGTSQLGLAFLFLEDDRLVGIKHYNLRASELAKNDPFLNEPIAKLDADARIKYIVAAVKLLLSKHSPYLVGIETPFLNALSVNAFAPLINQRLKLLKAIDELSQHFNICDQAPMRVKKHFKVSGKSSQQKKEAMRKAVLEHEVIGPHLVGRELSEHEIDAVGVAMATVEIG